MCYNEYMVKSCQIIAGILLCFFIVSNAKAIELQFPVACTLMQNCWITNHVDLDNSDGQIEDYMCGSKVTDGNSSTHISLGSMQAQEQNIPVVAVADGTVTTAKYVGGFCGLRIVIDHDKGWQSSYCHLKPETFIVKEGQKIKSGQILAAVGNSGSGTSWPRLSYALLRNNMVFDPFSGRTSLEGCSKQSKPLWTNAVNPLYEPAQVTSIGFNVGEVSNTSILYGTASEATVIDKSTPQLSLWGLLMNIQKGDEILLKIEDPSGRVLEESKFTANATRERYPIYLSQMRERLILDAGVYHGFITITRYVRARPITTGKFTKVILQ